MRTGRCLNVTSQQYVQQQQQVPEPTKQKIYINFVRAADISSNSNCRQYYYGKNVADIARFYCRDGRADAHFNQSAAAARKILQCAFDFSFLNCGCIVQGVIHRIMFCVYGINESMALRYDGSGNKMQ